MTGRKVLTDTDTDASRIAELQARRHKVVRLSRENREAQADRGRNVLQELGLVVRDDCKALSADEGQKVQPQPRAERLQRLLT